MRHDFSSPLEQLYESNHDLLCRGSRLILKEGVDEVIGDAAQFVVGAIAEYGLIATIAGAPAGPVVETLTDAMFAAESINSTLESVGSIVDSFGELSALIERILSLSLVGGFEAFYGEVKDIWISIGDLLPEASEEKLKELWIRHEMFWRKQFPNFPIL